MLLPLAAEVARAAEPKADADQEKNPEPEEITLTTKDGLELKGTYYASNLGKDAKEAVPIVLLHGFKGSRQDYAALAGKLQQLGHAVLVPDLRGHGESTKLRPPRTNRELTLEAGRLGRNDFGAMVLQDMEAIKKFLKEQNNSKQLNVQKLCVVGADMGAMVAINWSAWDWSVPPLGNVQQGKDVKALVLLSPRWNFKGMTINGALASDVLKKELSILLVFGEQVPANATDAERIYKQLKAARSGPAENDPKQRTYFYLPRKTTLQGTKILTEASLEADQLIANFIERRLVNQTIAWQDRRSPLEK